MVITKIIAARCNGLILFDFIFMAVHHNLQAILFVEPSLSSNGL